MPKKSTIKPVRSSSPAAVKPEVSASESSSGQLAGKRRDRKRDDRRAEDDGSSLPLQPVEPESSGLDALTPGWAERRGIEEAKLDAIELGKKPRKFHTRSTEVRMKMKLAQRARRAREHTEGRPNYG